MAADWRETMRQVLQGVMTPPAIPPNFQTPTSGIPLPPLGRFGTQAFDLAKLPTSIPKRVVTPAELIRSMAPPPVGGGGEGGSDHTNPLEDHLQDLIDQGVPVVPGIDSRIPRDAEPASSAPPDSGIDDEVFNPPEPVTIPLTPTAPSASRIPPPDPRGDGIVTIEDIPTPEMAGAQPYVPTSPSASRIPGGGSTGTPVVTIQDDPVAPYAPILPDNTITEHSAITQPGATVRDLLGPPKPDKPTVGDVLSGIGEFFTNPIGTVIGGGGGGNDSGGFNGTWGSGPNADYYQGVENPWTSNPLDTPSHYVDPYSGGGYSTGDPWLDEIERMKREGRLWELEQAGYKLG